MRRTSDLSVIAAGTRVTGRISGSGGLVIEGQVQGDVQVTGAAELADGASIQGDLSADSLELAGTLDGDASCAGAIVVRATATVKGDLKGASVTIEAGSTVDVRLDTDFSLEPLRAGRR